MIGSKKKLFCLSMNACDYVLKSKTTAVLLHSLKTFILLKKPRKLTETL